MAQTKVKPELLSGRFNTVTALTPASTITVDYDSAQIFTLTPTSNTTLNITKLFTNTDHNINNRDNTNTYANVMACCVCVCSCCLCVDICSCSFNCAATCMRLPLSKRYR